VPKVAADLRPGHRYNAACVAALAGCGQGADAAKLEAGERARLRGQALAWLRADLAQWDKQLGNGESADRQAAQRVLRHWQKDSDLAGVRDKEPLAKFPQAERNEWVKFWGEVATLLKRAQAHD
jgi:hypothetical protein